MKKWLDTQIENCLVAIDMVKSLPPRAFTRDLGEWTCGSAACLGGWVTRHPYFRAQGVRAWRELDPTATGEPITVDKRGGKHFSVAETLFGNYALFYSRDRWSATDASTFSDKQVALNRLEETLNKLLAKV